MVLLPVRGGGPDTKLRSRCNALCAVCHVFVSTTALLRLSLSQECFRYRVVMLVVSAQRGKWVGGVETKRRLNVGVLVRAVLWRRKAVVAGVSNGCRSVVDIATQLIRWTVDWLTQGQVARGCLSRFTRRPVGAVGIKL